MLRSYTGDLILLVPSLCHRALFQTSPSHSPQVYRCNEGPQPAQNNDLYNSEDVDFRL